MPKVRTLTIRTIGVGVAFTLSLLTRSYLDANASTTAVALSRSALAALHTSSSPTLRTNHAVATYAAHRPRTAASGLESNPDGTIPDDSQLVRDPSFELGHPNPDWAESTSNGVALIDQIDPRTGSWDGDLCGYPNCTSDELYQGFIVPSNIRTATLTFWSAGYCASTTTNCSTSDNSLRVGLIDGSNATLEIDLHTDAPAFTVGTYQGFSLDGTAFLQSRGGQAVEAFALATNNSGDEGGFFLDDVTLTANDPPTNIVASSPSSGQVSATWSPPPDASTNVVSGYTVALYGSLRNLVASQNVTTTSASFVGQSNGTPYYVVVTWVNGAATGASGESYSVTPFSGTAATTALTTSSTQQYVLPNSDGVTWQRMDETHLSVSISPGASENVLLSANADLWTWNAGFNQDFGIQVTPACSNDASTLAAWKESGGFAGTFSPNAAFVETICGMSSGTTYRVDIVWKTNRPAIDGSVSAGAGPLDGLFSPTRLTARVLPTGYQSAVSTQQYVLPNNDGSTWQPVDGTNLALTLSPGADEDVVLSGNADMWTWNAGYNQDLGLLVTPACGGAAATLDAWKESGGFAGTFSPNAAFVQSVCHLSGGTVYTVQLVWKTNKPAGGAQISIGAGSPGAFSPTRLTAWPLPANVSPELWHTVASGQQYTLTSSNGTMWQEIDNANLQTPGLSPSGAETVIVSGNSDLWTSDAGYNQDLAVFVSVDGGAPTLIGWKESGGFGGTFSPNAAFVQAVYGMASGHTYTFSLWWKANKGASGATIWAGAGPIAGSFSPTRLSVVPLT